MKLLKVFWSFVFAVASAFDYDTHDAVGQTTASAMDIKAIKQVKRLLGGKDVTDVAGWGHLVDDTFPGMERLHYQVHDDAVRPWCQVTDRVPKCEDNICLLQAIKHFYGEVLESEGRKIDHPQIDFNKVHAALTFSDADNLKMLINLLGDMHQPMHVGFAGDDMGREVKVRFRGKVMSLYDLWDSGISQVIRTEESSFWLGGWTHVGRIFHEFTHEQREWKKSKPFDMYDKWMEENVKFACEVAYKLRNGVAVAGPGGQKGVIDIDDSEFVHLREMLIHQVLLGGARTAIVLNDILDVEGAKQLHEGTNVHTRADDIERKQHEEWAKFKSSGSDKSSKSRSLSSVPWSWSNFCTNISIAIIVIPLFFVVANNGLNRKAYVEMFKGSDSQSERTPPRTRKRFE